MKFTCSSLAKNPASTIEISSMIKIWHFRQLRAIEGLDASWIHLSTELSPLPIPIIKGKKITFEVKAISMVLKFNVAVKTYELPRDACLYNIQSSLTNSFLLKIMNNNYFQHYIMANNLNIKFIFNEKSIKTAICA